MDHPPPWRWSPPQIALWDANDTDVITAPCDSCGDLMPIEGSPRALELIRAAPEMEALLRRLRDFEGAPYEKRSQMKGDLLLLLKRLDAARKAGG